MQKLTIASAALLCSWVAVSATAQTPEEAQQALATAQQAHAKSVELGHEWTVTVTALEEAKAAHEAGQYGEAIRHAEEATAFANASIDQAQREAEGWQMNIIK